MKNKVEGLNGISATVIADSVSEEGVRLLTFELVYPRIIHSEFLVHRQFSRNSASSRAIPFKKMIENLGAQPVRFGQANPGMQDKGEDFHAEVGAGYSPEEWWQLAELSAVNFSREFYEAGYAKQVYNRPLECFQFMKTIVTATEWENWFWLREDAAADPTIEYLARVMREAKDASEPETLKAGEYHLPYVESSRDAAGKQYFWWYLTPTEKLPLTVEEAIKVSAARSAAVSFRNVDYGLPKCLEVYERLVGDERKHSSSLEHQCSPIMPKHDGLVSMLQNHPSYPETWQEGISHADRDGQLWSGNMRGFIQHRKLIDGENKSGY